MIDDDIITLFRWLPSRFLNIRMIIELLVVVVVCVVNLVEEL